MYVVGAYGRTAQTQQAIRDPPYDREASQKRSQAAAYSVALDDIPLQEVVIPPNRSLERNRLPEASTVPVVESTIAVPVDKDIVVNSTVLFEEPVPDRVRTAV